MGGIFYKVYLVSFDITGIFTPQKLKKIRRDKGRLEARKLFNEIVLFI